MYICIYIYIYTGVYIYIYIYIYTGVAARVLDVGQRGAQRDHAQRRGQRLRAELAVAGLLIHTSLSLYIYDNNNNNYHYF